MTTIAAPVPPIEREFTVRSRSEWQLAVRRFMHNPLALAGLVTFLLMVVAVFGTDTIGRDVLLLTLRGIQWSLLMCVVFVVVACAAGVLVGAVAGYFGGFVDDLLMRAVDVTLTLPFLAVVLVVVAAFPGARSPVGIALLIALSSWMALARIVRAQFLSLREREYVEAAHALGASNRRIVLRHLVPNSLGQIIVWATLGATGAIGAEAALSYLGFGVQGSDVSLGRLVADGAAAAASRPWLFYFPGLTLLLIVLAVSLVGDGIQDAFDPSVIRER